MSLTLKEEFIQSRSYIWNALIIIILTTLPQFLMSQSQKHFFIILLVTFFLLLVSKTSKTIFALFVTYLLVINLLQANVAFHWGGGSDDLSPRIEVAMISPSYETTEYLKEFIDVRDYAMLLYTLIVLVLLLWFVVYHKHNNKRLKKYAFSLALLVALILQNQQPFKLIKTFVSLNERSDIIHARNTFLQQNQSNIKPMKSLRYDKIIIIQGEAANKNFMHIYGYRVATTPYFTKLLKEHTLSTFNAIAPSNQTRFSIPMIFSKADVHNWRDNFIHSQSLVSDLRQYGYKTYWISNQGRIGEHEDYITSIAVEADNTSFLHQNSKTSRHTDRVISEYLTHQKLNSEPEMFVFHLMGSHVGYRARYEPKNALFPHPKDVIHEYLNTIHFTDSIIHDVIEHFNHNGLKILVVYLSDHGEVVTLKKHGHGLLPTFKDEYDIPLVVYSNIKNSRIDEVQQQHRDKIINAESLHSFVSYISGATDDVNLSYSNKIFSLDPKNIYDYTKLEYYTP